MRLLYHLLWLSIVFKVNGEEGKEEIELSSSRSLPSISTSTSTSSTSTSIILNTTAIPNIEIEVLDENFIELALDSKPIISLNSTLNKTLDETEAMANILTNNSTINLTSNSVDSTISTSTVLTPSPLETPRQLNNPTDSLPVSEILPIAIPIVEPLPVIPIIELPSPPELLSFNEWREKYVPPSDPSSRRVRKVRPKSEVVTSESLGSESNEIGVKGGHIMGGDIGKPGNMNATVGDRIVGDQIVEKKEGDSREVPKQIVQSDRLEGTVSGDRNIENKAASSPIQPLVNVGTGGPLDPLTALKDRSNYALFECSATVHRASKESKGSGAILVEKKDRYMLTPCSASPQFVELELCDEIQIDTVALANFEFFSSMFKHFSIKVSVNYPGRVDEWHDLGTFRARNARGVQVFNTKALGSFYRYMRIDFLTHYGSEYFCPVSLLRVYGITQMDAFRRDERLRAIEAEALEKLLKEEEYEYVTEAEEVKKVVEVEEISVPQIAQIMLSKEEEAAVNSSSYSEVPESSTIISASIEDTAVPTPVPTIIDEITSEAPTTVARPSVFSTSSKPIPSIITSPDLSSYVEILTADIETLQTTLSITRVVSEIEIDASSETPLPAPTSSQSPPSTPSSTLAEIKSLSVPIAASSSLILNGPSTINASTLKSLESNISTLTSSLLTSSISLPPTNSSTSATDETMVFTTSVVASVVNSSNGSSSTLISTTSMTAIPSSSLVIKERSSNSTTLSSHNSTSQVNTFTQSSNATTSTSILVSVSISVNETKATVLSSSTTTSIKVFPPVVVPTSQPAPSTNKSEPIATRAIPNMPLTPPPNTQQQPGESIYGTIMKRLTGLEHNQTLSMHFIELQSGVLRDAFSRVEKRLGEIESGRGELEGLVRMGFREMELLRKEMERERGELAGKVNILSQELLFERRLGLAQLIGLFALFVFVGLTRGSTTIPLHLVSRQVRRRTSSKNESDSHDEDVGNTDTSLHAFRNKIDRSDSTGSQESARNKAGRTSSLPLPRSTGKRYSTAPRRNYSVAAPSKLSKTIRDWNPPRQSSAPPDMFSLPFTRPGGINEPFSPSYNSSARRRASIKPHREREGSATTITSSNNTGISPTSPYKRLPPFENENSNDVESEITTSGNETDSERETWNDTGDESTNSASKLISTSNDATPGGERRRSHWDNGEERIEDMFNDTKGSPLPLQRLPNPPPENGKSDNELETK